MLKLQGKSDKTIDVYARAVRRVSLDSNLCPDNMERPANSSGGPFA